MDAGTRPVWLPPENTISVVGAGTWWDAVAIDGTLGAWAAHHLCSAEEEQGPIACEPRGPLPRWYFLVPVGTSERWSEPGTTALGACCYIGLPGTLTPGTHTVHWVVPPRCDGEEPLLLDPARLRAAVGAARAALST